MIFVTFRILLRIKYLIIIIKLSISSSIQVMAEGLFKAKVISIVTQISISSVCSLYDENANIASPERPRLVRLISPTNTSVHDLLLIDSPKFHLILDFATNVEAYHLTIRGGNLGSYDGIDAIGTNYYIHDNEVRRYISL